MGNQHKARIEAHRAKLHTALTRSPPDDAYPINLKWMVDLFFYKHISSLTTHLKRHFHEDIDYMKQPDGKRSWSYYITLNCFVKICKYARHAKRQAVSKHWMRLLKRTKRGGITLGSMNGGGGGIGIGRGGGRNNIGYGVESSSESERDEAHQAAMEKWDSAEEGDDNTDGEYEHSTPEEENEDGEDEDDMDEDSSEQPSDSRIPEHIYSSLIAQSPAIAIPFLSDWSYLRLVPLTLHPHASSPSPSPSSAPARIQILSPISQQTLQQRLQAYTAFGAQYSNALHQKNILNGGGSSCFSSSPPSPAPSSYSLSSSNAYGSCTRQVIIRPAVAFPTHVRTITIKNYNNNNNNNSNSNNNNGNNNMDDSNGASNELDSSFDTNIFLSFSDEQQQYQQ